MVLHQAVGYRETEVIAGIAITLFNSVMCFFALRYFDQALKARDLDYIRQLVIEALREVEVES